MNIISLEKWIEIGNAWRDKSGFSRSIVSIGVDKDKGELTASTVQHRATLADAIWKQSRTSDEKAANNRVRAEFVRSLCAALGIKVEENGGDQDIGADYKIGNGILDSLSKEIGAAFIKEDFNCGKPLSDRRVCQIMKKVNTFDNRVCRPFLKEKEVYKVTPDNEASNATVVARFLNEAENCISGGKKSIPQFLFHVADAMAFAETEKDKDMVAEKALKLLVDADLFDDAESVAKTMETITDFCNGLNEKDFDHGAVRFRDYIMTNIPNTEAGKEWQRIQANKIISDCLDAVISSSVRDKKNISFMLSEDDKKEMCKTLTANSSKLITSQAELKDRELERFIENSGMIRDLCRGMEIKIGDETRISGGVEKSGKHRLVKLDKNKGDYASVSAVAQTMKKFFTTKSGTVNWAALKHACIVCTQVMPNILQGLMQQHLMACRKVDYGFQYKYGGFMSFEIAKCKDGDFYVKAVFGDDNKEEHSRMLLDGYSAEIPTQQMQFKCRTSCTVKLPNEGNKFEIVGDIKFEGSIGVSKV